MGTTLSVILLIAIVLAAGLLRDSFRTKAVERWAPGARLRARAESGT